MDAHRVIGTMHCDEGIQIGVFYLNHRIDAPKARIRPDGDGREWRSDQALFIGSDSPTETIFRACHDGKRLYLLAEQLDPASAGGAEIRLSVGYGGRRVDLTVASDGSVVSPIPGIRGASRAGLTPAGVPGRATEIAAGRHAAVQCDSSQRSGRRRIHRRDGRPRNMDAHRTEITAKRNNP